MIVWDEKGNLFDHGRRLMHWAEIADVRIDQAPRRTRGLDEDGVLTHLGRVQGDYARLSAGLVAYAEENERFRQQLRNPGGPGPHVNDAAHRMARDVLKDGQDEANKRIRAASAVAAQIIGGARTIRRTIIGEAEAEAEEKGREAAARERGTPSAAPAASAQTAEDLTREVAALREANAGLREKNAYLDAYSDALRSHFRTHAEVTLRDLDEWEQRVPAPAVRDLVPAAGPVTADLGIAAAPVDAPLPPDPPGRTTP